MSGVLEDGAAGGGVGRWGLVHLAPRGLHHQAAVGLLVVADAHHVDSHSRPKMRAGEGQRAAPLAGAGLGGQPLDAGLAVVVGLGTAVLGLC